MKLELIQTKQVYSSYRPDTACFIGFIPRGIAWLEDIQIKFQPWFRREERQQLHSTERHCEAQLARSFSFWLLSFFFSLPKHLTENVFEIAQTIEHSCICSCRNGHEMTMGGVFWMDAEVWWRPCCQSPCRRMRWAGRTTHIRWQKHEIVCTGWGQKHFQPHTLLLILINNKIEVKFQGKNLVIFPLLYASRFWCSMALGLAELEGVFSWLIAQSC